MNFPLPILFINSNAITILFLTDILFEMHNPNWYQTLKLLTL